MNPNPELKAPPPATSIEVRQLSARQEQAQWAAWLAEAEMAGVQGQSFAVGGTGHYTAPAIILGRSQSRIVTEVQSRCEAKGLPLDVMVRDSGGTAVLAGPWMVFAGVALSKHHPLYCARWRDNYAWFAGAHEQVLRQLQVPVEVLNPDQPLPPPIHHLPWACFGGLSSWELTADGGRKLVGVAQRHTRHATLLVSGTLVLPSEWSQLADAMGYPDQVEQLATTTVALSELTQDITTINLAHRLADQLWHDLVRAEGMDLTRESPPDADFTLY